MATSISRMYGYAPTITELYKTEDETRQARRKMFDSMDLKGTGVITIDEWPKLCVEHIIANAATLAAHPILDHGKVEEFKVFVTAALVIGSPEHTEMYWFLLGLFTESDPGKDGGCQGATSQHGDGGRQGVPSQRRDEGHHGAKEGGQDE